MPAPRGPRHGGAQVVVFRLDAIEPLLLPWAHDLAFCGLCQRQVDPGVRTARPLGLAGAFEALDGEGANALEHPETRAAVAVLAAQQAVSD